MARRLAIACATLAWLLLAASGQSIAAGGGETAAQRLIDAYAPRLMLREEQDPPCETSAEQYQPTSVSTMLGNPAVELTRAVPAEA
jgi:hypothetical protein